MKKKTVQVLGTAEEFEKVRGRQSEKGEHKQHLHQKQNVVFAVFNLNNIGLTTFVFWELGNFDLLLPILPRVTDGGSNNF